MTLEEINQQILQKQGRAREVHAESVSLKNELKKLYEDRKEKQMEAFFDFMELGTEIDINTYCYLTGYPNGKTLKKLKEDKNYYDCQRNLRLGKESTIEVIKVNKKTINIKVKKRVSTAYNKPTVVDYPDDTYRVNRRKLYVQLMRDPEFKKRVELTFKRKNVLDAILD